MRMPPELVPATLMPSDTVLEQLQGDVTVDLGGAAGDLLAKIVPDAKKALVIDCNLQLLVKGKTSGIDAQMGWINADARQCPVQAAIADLVIMQGLLTTVPHVNSQVQVAREAARILKQNGILYVSDFLINDHIERYTQRYKFGKSGVFAAHNHQGKWLYDAKHWQVNELLGLFTGNFEPRIISESTVRTRSGNQVRGIELIMSRRLRRVPAA
jgi:ubiquinone/menaquinone biosynthesis C-methylase UbiE